MIVLNIKCETDEKTWELRNRMCEALAGSPAFINNEIAVCDFVDVPNAFMVCLGKSNDADIEFDLIGSDFLVRSDAKEEAAKYGSQYD